MKRSISFIVFLFLFRFAIQGQTPFFQHYFLLKKNEPVNVNILYQDKTGFVWCGTNRGLFKFNGVKFQRYGLSDSLTDDNVTAITEDSLHRIWVGCKSGSISYLEKDKFKKFETKEGSIEQPISKILFDKKGVMWFATLNDGLYYFRKNRLYRIDEVNGMPDLYIYDIAEDANGNIWAGTDGGAVACQLKDTVRLKVYNYKNGLPDNIIKKITIATDGKIWMSTDNAGIIVFDPASEKYKPLIKDGWHDGDITNFVIDGNLVWIAADPIGLVLFDQSTQRIKIFNSRDISGITLVNSLIKDTEGNIWAGSKTSVLRTPGDFIEYLETTWQSKPINAEAVAVDKTGTIWWAGKEGLFEKSLSGNGKIEKKLIGTPYEKFTITSLYADDNGFLWVGFYGEGILRINTITGAMRHIHAELLNGNVLNITGKGNVIWLATLEGAMRIELQGDNISFKSYSSKDGLSSDYIYQVFIDSQNRIWFATDGKGADMLDNKGFHHFYEGLNSKIVYGFAEDGKHNIWANVSDGVYVLEEKKFKMLSPDLGLRDNAISGLMSTSKGNILVVHDLGIDLYSISRKKISYVADETGMRDKLPNLNATARDSQGRIFIGTSEGIVIYSYHQERSNRNPTGFIDGVKVMDKNIDFDKAINLPYDQNFITLDYLGIWYQNPTDLFYQIKLDNYDREWIVRRDHSATYSNLPPGDYIFRLRVSETRDFTNTKETILKLTIDPPFWRTPWFYILSTLTIVAAGYIIVMTRERKLLQDKHALEAKVKERTIEIQRKTEEIQAQNEEIQSQAEEIKGINENLELLVKDRTLELVKKNKALEEYAFITAHNLRAPVASVLGLINLACKLELDEESKIIITHLQTSAEKLDAIVRSITEAIEKAE